MDKYLIIAFGSQVSGRSNDKSDHDFAVLSSDSLSLSDRVQVSDYLSEKFHINEDKIDLVDLNTASPILKFEVAQKGKLIHGEYDLFIRFKVRAFKEYVDTAKFRRHREKIMQERYAK